MRFRLLPAVVVVAVAILASAITSAQQGASSTPSLAGAWRISEIRYTGPNARTVTNPQPGIFTATPRYYTFAMVTSDTPRAATKQLPPPGPQLDKLIADAAIAFFAFGGPYEIKGNVATFRFDVNMNPNDMGPGRFVEGTTRFEGKDTWLFTQTRSADGPIPNPTTFKWTRLK
jgi:hypothetical protein